MHPGLPTFLHLGSQKKLMSWMRHVTGVRFHSNECPSLIYGVNNLGNDHESRHFLVFHLLFKDLFFEFSLASRDSSHFFFRIFLTCVCDRTFFPLSIILTLLASHIIDESGNPRNQQQIHWTPPSYSTERAGPLGWIPSKPCHDSSPPISSDLSWLKQDEVVSFCIAPFSDTTTYWNIYNII